MTIHRAQAVRQAGFAGLVLLLAFTASATRAPEQAPRRPPEPFSVFVHASEPDDADLREGLEKAADEIRDRVRGRRNWFRIADAAEGAAITVRVINYRTSQMMLPKLERLVINGRVELVERSEIVEYHYVDAVALAGTLRQSLTGLDERETGPSLRNAANHLAEQLEEFCKDNYAALTSR
jgi:hypothetical protein